MAKEKDDDECNNSISIDNFLENEKMMFLGQHTTNLTEQRGIILPESFLTVFRGKDKAGTLFMIISEAHNQYVSKVLSLDMKLPECFLLYSMESVASFYRILNPASDSSLDILSFYFLNSQLYRTNIAVNGKITLPSPLLEKMKFPTQKSKYTLTGLGTCVAVYPIYKNEEFEQYLADNMSSQKNQTLK